MTSLATPSRTVKTVAGIAAASLCVTGFGVLTAPVADAKPAPRDPVSSKVTFATAPTGLTMSGWAVDPDAPTTNLKIRAILDGTKTVAATYTSIANAAVTKKYGASETPGYRLAVPVPSGKHTVCAILSNIGGGLSIVKKCVSTPLGRTLTAKQKAKRSPRGAIQVATASAGSVHLAGWISDPDFLQQRRRFTVYLNGQAQPVKTTFRYPGTRPKGAGKDSKFDLTLPVANTTQIACIQVPNVGIGTRTFLGCRAIDPRGASSSTTPPVAPAANGKVLKLAKKQIGKPYVWAAAGPKSFDCSGLVMWSYRKNKMTTPRVAADQRRASRLIPLARAVPGDLVFYHDSTGSVYHVGIFVKPGLSVAAIDESQGVDYQRIYDPTATYGSFTHT